MDEDAAEGTVSLYYIQIRHRSDDSRTAFAYSIGEEGGPTVDVHHLNPRLNVSYSKLAIVRFNSAGPIILK